jgi:hypothetical protein
MPLFKIRSFSFILFITFRFYILKSIADSDVTEKSNIKTVSTTEILSNQVAISKIDSNVKQSSTQVSGGVRKISTSDMDNNSNDGTKYMFSSFMELTKNQKVVDYKTFINWEYLSDLLNQRLILPYMIDESLNLANVTLVSSIDYSQFLKIMNNLDDRRLDYQLELLGENNFNITLSDIELLDLTEMNDDNVNIITEQLDEPFPSADLESVDIQTPSSKPSSEPTTN